MHVRDLLDEDAIHHRGLPVTSGPQTWLDLATVLPPPELVAVGDALYRVGHLDQHSVARRLTRADGVRGVVRARQWGPLLSPLAMSRPESVVRCVLTEAGLPPLDLRWRSRVRPVGPSRTATSAGRSGGWPSSTRGGSTRNAGSSAGTSTGTR